LYVGLSVSFSIGFRSKSVWGQYTKSCLAGFVFEYLSVQYNALLCIKLKLICSVFFKDCLSYNKLACDNITDFIRKMNSS